MNRLIVIATLASVASFGTASEDLNEIRKIGPFNLGDNASFGSAITANLTRIITGAPSIDLAGEDSGAVYVHVTTTGQQLFRFTAPDASEFDEFGFSVAATGQRVIVGAPYADGVAAGTGAVYVFDVHSGSFLQKFTALDSEFDDTFGSSVGVSGTRVIIGAPRNDDEEPNAGAAYIFDLTTGQQLHKLTTDDAASGDFFGVSAAISGSFAVIGAFADDYDGVAFAGSAYVFDALTGQQLHKLIPSQPERRGFFGTSVAISGNIVVVGSQENGSAGTDSGAAYVFDAGTGEQLHRLTPSTLSASDRFGESVAINGNFIVVGARGDEVNGEDTGTAFVFDALSGQELYRVVPSDGVDADEFGASVAVLGTRAFVGSPTAEAPVGPDSGAAYIFDITPCFADVNNDNTVDLADLNIILGNFGQTTSDGDTNSDGVVDLADLNRVLSDFGNDCP